MPRRKPHVVNLADFKKKKAEEGAIPIDLGDGDIIHTRSPFVMSNDEIAEMNDTDDVEKVGRIVLGDDQYDRFVAAGGTTALLMAIIEDNGITAASGESGASSNS